MYECAKKSSAQDAKLIAKTPFKLYFYNNNNNIESLSVLMIPRG